VNDPGYARLSGLPTHRKGVLHERRDHVLSRAAALCRRAEVLELKGRFRERIMSCCCAALDVDPPSRPFMRKDTGPGAKSWAWLIGDLEEPFRLCSSSASGEFPALLPVNGDVNPRQSSESLEHIENNCCRDEPLKSYHLHHFFYNMTLYVEESSCPLQLVSSKISLINLSHDL
jgi:hypothetical protein